MPGAEVIAARPTPATTTRPAGFGSQPTVGTDVVRPRGAVADAVVPMAMARLGQDSTIVTTLGGSVANFCTTG